MSHKHADKRLALAESEWASEIHRRISAIALCLPETKEKWSWGHPTYRVGAREKMFASFGGSEEGASMGVKTSMERQAELAGGDFRFVVAKYVGKHGWVSMSLDEDHPEDLDWSLIEELLVDSWRRVAPKKILKAWQAERQPSATGES